MSELDDLPSWAGRSTEEVQLPDGPPESTPVAEDPVPEPPALPTEDQPEIAAPTAAAVGATEAPAATTMLPVEEPRRRSRLRTLLFVLLGLAVVAGAAAAGYVLATQDSDSTEASGAAADGDSEGADAATDDAAAADGTEATDSGDTEGTATADSSDTDATEDADQAAADGEDAEGAETVTVEVDPEGEDAGSDAGDDNAALNDGDRQAIFRNGMVYLSGAVPSEEIGQQIVAKAEAVVGEGNVINEYTIDPSVTIEPGSSAPLYVEDVILFGFNSIEIAPPFLPILDLGTLLLRQNPQASVTVVTRTDAVGSEEVNLEVARARAQAVINYWLGQGVNPDQIEADPRGEEGTSEDDDAETAARQRRAEFIITGLLD